MRNEDKLNAIKAIEVIVSLDCSPTEFSFGYTQDKICKDGLLIKKCCPLVVTELVARGFSISMMEQGMLVTKIG